MSWGFFFPLTPIHPEVLYFSGFAPFSSYAGQSDWNQRLRASAIAFSGTWALRIHRMLPVLSGTVALLIVVTDMLIAWLPAEGCPSTENAIYVRSASGALVVVSESVWCYLRRTTQVHC